MSWFKKLKDGLKKSSTKIGQGITDIVTKKKLDDATLEELEELLISADLGVEASIKVTESLRKSRFGKDVSDDEVKEALSESITEILTPVAQELSLQGHTPEVILVVGVNGSGKTTTIGKLAAHYKSKGKSVMLAAGDTFRAAAIEQLHIWAERTEAKVVSTKIGGDAAALAYDALEQAQAAGVDVLLIDTAGRLHNKADLMEELAKVRRTLQKLDSNTPHHTILVLDATTGQNAIAQTKTFLELIDVTGLAVTKLDGTARGGVVVALAEQFSLPVYAVGVGEQADDLQPFDAEDFANNLIGIEKAA